MSRPFAIVCLAVLCLVSAGSLHGEESKPAARPESPEAATQLFLDSLNKQDQKAFEVSVIQDDLAKSVFHFAKAAESFKKKMIAAYGEVGWKNFQDADGARVSLSYHDLKVDDLKFETEGDTAKAKGREDDELALCLVRKDGAWQVDLNQSLESQSDDNGLSAKGLADAFSSMAKTMRSYESKVGEGTSVDQLDKEMGAEFLSALLGAGAKPKISISVKPN